MHRYESVLVRRSYRDGKKVRHETLANLSKLPADAIAAIEATLKGQRLAPVGQDFTITRSLPHGDVAAVTECDRLRRSSKRRNDSWRLPPRPSGDFL